MARDTGSDLIWFTAGAAIGAAIALLYAPKAGKETREYIGKQSRKGRDVLAETGGDLAQRGKDLFDQGRRLADEAADMFERGRKILEG